MLDRAGNSHQLSSKKSNGMRNLIDSHYSAISQKRAETMPDLEKLNESSVESMAADI